MNEPRCLYAMIFVESEHHERIVREFVRPMAHRFQSNENLDSLFFVRFNVPSWQVRFRVLGNPDWIEGLVRPLIRQELQTLEERGEINSFQFGTYQRELPRYGGPVGMQLAEKIFFHDSLAALDFLEAYDREECSRSRRELNLLITDRFLDLLGSSREERIAFYQLGYQWALEQNTWQDKELRALDTRFQALRSGLEELLSPARQSDPAWVFGGTRPAAIAETLFQSIRPILQEVRQRHQSGEITQDWSYLIWSYTHMFCNRLGIDPTAEAILRYFMHRLLTVVHHSSATASG